MNERSNTTNFVRAEGLDKFYTIPETVDKCLDELNEKFPLHKFDLKVEPSAGNGSFFNKLTGNKVGLDISPECNSIIKKDFFDYKPETEYTNILVVGNPPFGKSSSLAIKFFNHSAEFANVIAFIVPRTFRRISVQNKLHKNFHLVDDYTLPQNPCCFTPKMSVKCCFQVWEMNTITRQIIKLPLTHPHWDFIPLGTQDDKGQPTPPQNCDFVIKAYGGKCGEICTENLETLRPKSWHWIKVNTELIQCDKLISNFKKLDYSISLDTARQNSIGKAELVSLYNSL